MPTFQGQVSEEEIVELIAFIKSFAARRDAAARGGAIRRPPRTPPINPREEKP